MRRILPLCLAVSALLAAVYGPARAAAAYPPLPPEWERWRGLATEAIWADACAVDDCGDGLLADGRDVWQVANGLVVGIWDFDQLPAGSGSCLPGAGEHVARVYVCLGARLLDAPAGGVAVEDRWPLPCIRRYETGGGVDPAGNPADPDWGDGYANAYQFDAGTWAGAVTAAGYPGWVADRLAPRHVQAAAAWQLFLERGTSPWPTPHAYC